MNEIIFSSWSFAAFVVNIYPVNPVYPVQPPSVRPSGCGARSFRFQVSGLKFLIRQSPIRLSPPRRARNSNSDFGLRISLGSPPACHARRHALSRMLARIKSRKTPINIVNVTVARMFYPLKVYPRYISASSCSSAASATSCSMLMPQSPVHGPHSSIPAFQHSVISSQQSRFRSSQTSFRT